MTEASAKARRGDLAIMRVYEPGRHCVPAEPRSGYCLAIVASVDRAGLVKTATRDSGAAWPRDLTGQAHTVGAAEKVGDVFACIRDLPDVYATPAAAIDAFKEWHAKRTVAAPLEVA